MPRKGSRLSADLNLEKLFQDFENEYLSQNYQSKEHTNIVVKESRLCSPETKLKEVNLIKAFLDNPCKCGKSCQNQFSLEEIIDARDNFNLLSWREKACFMLPLLNSFRTISNESSSGRTMSERIRQKYTYKINSDRYVCRETFLFYYDISLKKLKYFQNHLKEAGITPPDHGNVGKKPDNAYSEEDKKFVKLFLINFSSTHGMPDPGRDLRTGINKLKIFLPSAMSFRYVHKMYLKSVPGSRRAVGYQSFLKIWQEVAPNIKFQKPRTDLCQTCEDHIKNIRMAIGRKEESEKIRYYKDAIKHLQQAKKERDYYRKVIKKTQEVYKNLFDENIPPCKRKKSIRKFSMHYSWDFAQQINYPYEDQQVGPIYFKTPRRAQLFGVCCEAIPCQFNYLIDEADFLNKGANTVISLLDHFFANYGLGESSVYLTADNCVSQNKNNAMIHYLLFRIMMGLHDAISLSFMIVGHTKFGPDGYFGLIKRVYRKAKVYTYNQLVALIRKASPNGHLLCQSFRNESGEQSYQYYQWDTWLSKYFHNLPDIKKYHHFLFSNKTLGVVTVKESVNGKAYKFNLLRDTKERNTMKSERPSILFPAGLSLDRQWYLYENIREHIPEEIDKDITCPRPKSPKRN